MKHRVQVDDTPSTPATSMADANYNASSASRSPSREFTISPDLAGLRLDQALARLLPEHSRSRIKAWIEAGGVTVDGAKAPGKHRLLGAEVRGHQAAGAQAGVGRQRHELGYGRQRDEARVNVLARVVDGLLRISADRVDDRDRAAGSEGEGQ